jgi:DNA-binding CsgD family transcriptional regulator
MRLYGRAEQCRAVAAMLADVRRGHSRALVLRGEAGIGKTALLNHAAAEATDFRIARADGVESEMELPFAALHQLCGPMLDHLDRLPAPQRDALGVALGLRSGTVPDRFLVSLAVLGLLSGVAADQPLLCLIDDAQWLDQISAQVLAFVTRRLEAESVVMMFATREGEGGGDLAGLPELRLAGLSEADSRALLASVVPGRLDQQIRDRIAAESGGNPLALLELPNRVTAAELAGGFGRPGPLPLADRIEQSFGRRIALLPEESRTLLLLAAAEPVGDPVLLWRAAQRLGVGSDAAAPAKQAGLLTVTDRVTFRHPLVRSAVYQAAALADRRRVHQAIAEVTDPDTDPDRRAWHRAQATAGPDEDIAAELERSAGRAQARGGLAAAATFLEHATALTPGPADRAARALAAGQAKYDAGMPDAAVEQLAIAEAGPLGGLDRARLERLRAQIAFTRNRGSDAPQLLLRAARRLAPLDAALAREAYLEALWAAIRVGGPAVREVAEAALTAPPAPDPPRAIDLLLDALAIRSAKSYQEAVPELHRALQTLLDDEGLADARWLWLGCHTAMDLWDDETCRALGARHVERAREAGALTMLPIALNYRAAHEVFAGEFAAAVALFDEADVILAATGNARLADFSLLMAAWRGQASAPFDAALAEAAARGEGLSMAGIEFAAAVLHNGREDYPAALAAARQAREHDELGFGVWVLPELIEAAVRTGEHQAAAVALGQLSERVSLSRTRWAHGVVACSRALLTAGPAAEDLYREAIALIAPSQMTVMLGRAHLDYGEWLRGQNRRADAREQLRTAHQIFATMGAEGFAARAARQLRATGEQVRERGTAEQPAELTAREAQIAKLAADGRSNPEIGAQLFLSPRTVEYHLAKVFAKLAISSRGQLAAALGQHQVTRHDAAG